MPRTEDQYKEIRAGKKQLITNTALKLFAEQGYLTVSIQQITRDAGISKGLIYNYFDSKESLLRHIIHSTIDEMHQNFDPNQDGVLEQNEFENYVRYTLRSVRENPEFYKLYFELSAQPSVMKILEEKTEEVGKSMSQMLLNYFSRKGYEDPLTEMAIFSALLSGTMQKYVFAPHYFPLDKIEKRIIEMFK